MNKNLTFKKDDIIFDITTRAENVKFNEDSNLKEEINKLNRRIDSIPVGGIGGDGESGGVIVDNSEHNSLKINSEEGVHNFRFYDNKFSHKNEEGEWEDIEITSSSSEGSGIKLPPTKFIEITSNDTSNIIKWEDADNQVLNGATISTWAGTKLIRKIDSPPTNEHDGEVLVDNTERDFYKTTGFVDEDIELDTIYYYALFPYSTDGTYNYDISNIRKFYKNSASVPLNSTNIKVIPDIKSTKLKWSDGESTLDALWAGTKVVRKVGSPPVTETDGVLIIDNNSRDKYKTTYFIDDTATQNVEYFYGFFPYSRDGNYNTNIENVSSCTPATGKIYTLNIDLNNTSPSGACTYLDDAVNIGTGDAWDRIDIFQGIKPCLFKNEQVNYYLDKRYPTKKIDGSSANLNGIDGDAMSEISFMCIKVWNPDSNNLRISFSTDRNLLKSDLGYEALPFIDKDGNIADKIYVGMYQGYIDSGLLFSNSGKTFNSSNSYQYSINQIFDACKARGEYFLPYSFAIHQMLVLLYMLRFRTRSCFENLTNSTNTFVNETGTKNNSGMWSKDNVGKWAGIEWGAVNCHLFLAGVRLEPNHSGTIYRHNCTVMHPKNFYQVTTTFSNNLKSLQYSFYNSSNSSGNIHSGFAGHTRYMLGGQGIMFPRGNQSGGSSSTCFTNYIYISRNQSTNTYDSLLFIHFLPTSGVYKSILNYYEYDLTGNGLSDTYFGTYLTYVKGEAE